MRATTTLIVVVLGLSQLHGAAHAERTKCAKNNDPCAVLWSTEDVLSLRERQSLDAICQLNVAGKSALAVKNWQMLPTDERQWLLRRLAGWPLGATLLAQTLPKELWLTDNDRELDESCRRDEAQCWARKSPQRDLKTKVSGCGANLWSQLSNWGLTSRSGSSAAKLMQCFLVHPDNKKVWADLAQTFGPSDTSGFLDEQQRDPGNSTLLTFVGGTNDHIDLVVGDPSPDIVHARVMAIVQGLALFAAVVPRGSSISVSVARHEGNLLQPTTNDSRVGESSALSRAHWLLSVGPDEEERVEWVRSDRSGCISLEIAMEPTSAIYVDGVQVGCEAELSKPMESVQRYRVQVSLDDVHDLAVIGRPVRGGPRTQLLFHDDDLSLESIPRGRCKEQRLDLRQKIFRNAVALLGVETNPLCGEAGVDRARLHYAIVSYLASMHYDVKDVETWAETVTGLVALKQALHALGGAPIGAERGRLNALRAVGDGGEELLRQGFGTVLSASIECSRQNDADGWGYSVVARKLDVRELVERARDTVSGVSLDEIVDSKMEFATQRQRLRAAVAKLIADLYGNPYVRFVDLPDSSSFLDELPVGVEARSSAARSVTLATRSLSTTEARRVCQRIELHGSLAGDRPEGLANDDWQEVRTLQLPVNKRPSDFTKSVLAGRPGPLLLYTRLGETELQGLSFVSEDYACVELRERVPIMWLDFLPFVAPFKSYDLLGSEMDALGVLASAGPSGSAFEAWAGYVRTSRLSQVLPSWDDLVSAPTQYDPNGQLHEPFRIRADWVLLGGAWRADPRVCSVFGRFTCDPIWRRLGFSARLGVFGSVRFTDFSELPHGAESSRGASVRLDLGVGASAGLRYAVSDAVSLRVLFHVMMPYLGDFITTEGPAPFGGTARIHDADYDNRLLYGMSIGVGLGAFPGVSP